MTLGLASAMRVDSSAAAMRVLEQGGIDLMLLDCTLPDGIDRRLVPAADALSAPVILMSGDPERMKGLTEQPRPFILKPFTPADLQVKLAEIDEKLRLKKRQRAQEPLIEPADVPRNTTARSGS